MHISLIVNTGSADVLGTLRATVAKLREAGHTVRPRLTFEAGDARTFARQAGADGAELVIAGGGDGTINEVVNGLYDWMEHAPHAAGEPRLPRLGVIPLGTGNDLATALGIPTEPEQAVANAVVGVPLAADVAVVNGRRFLNVSTGGFGAEATEETPDELKGILGPLAYVITGVRKFVEMDVPSAHFTVDGETLHHGPFLIFAVGNARRTGGGNWLTPRAELHDGLLDVLIVREVSRVDFLALAPQLRAGNHLDHPAVIYRRVKHLRVECPEELHVNADGEPLRGHRFDYSISEHRLEVMLPEERTWTNEEDGGKGDKARAEAEAGDASEEGKAGE